MSCADEKLESSAIIPIKSNGECLGILHVSDEIENKLSDEIIGKLETVSIMISFLLKKVDELFAAEKKRKHKILIVDDEIDITKYLTKFFNHIGFEAYSAFDGIEALEIICLNKIDIVISDINMPKMNGTQLVEEIRKRFGIYGPKILLLTGTYCAISKEYLKQYNISALLEKPIDCLNSFVKLVEELVNN